METGEQTKRLNNVFTDNNIGHNIILKQIKKKSRKKYLKKLRNLKQIRFTKCRRTYLLYETGLNY